MDKPWVQVLALGTKHHSSEWWCGVLGGRRTALRRTWGTEMRLRHDRCVLRGGFARYRQLYHHPHHHQLPSLPFIITIITQLQLHATVATDTTTSITT